jgi:glutaredoxin
MITCPYCKKDMRDLHEYVNDKSIRVIVWYCPDSDFVLLLPTTTIGVEWHDVYGEKKA